MARENEELELDAAPMELDDSLFERRSDIDGFSIVPRKGRRPRIHLLRPWNECNTEEDKAGEVVRVQGSREALAAALVELGYRRGGIPCRRCFPAPSSEERLEGYRSETAYAPGEEGLPQ